MIIMSLLMNKLKNLKNLYHDEYIKTITPTVSPSNEKKKVVPFPRPSTVLNQNKLLTIDINNVIHKSIIDAF